MQLLSMAEVCGQIGVKRNTIYRWMESGTFPRPIKVGPNANRWRDTDVEEWIDKRANAGS